MRKTITFEDWGVQRCQASRNRNARMQRSRAEVKRDTDTGMQREQTIPRSTRKTAKVQRKKMGSDRDEGIQE